MKKVKRKVSNKRPQSKKGREVDEEDEDSDEDENRVEELVDMELLKQEMEEAIKHMQIELTKNVTLRPSTGKVYVFLLVLYVNLVNCPAKCFFFSE